MTFPEKLIDKSKNSTTRQLDSLHKHTAFHIAGTAGVFPRWLFGKWRVDFGILQIMEMRASAANDVGTPLLGHCSHFRKDVRPRDAKVAIRSKNITSHRHLGFVQPVGLKL